MPAWQTEAHLIAVETREMSCSRLACFWLYSPVMRGGKWSERLVRLGQALVLAAIASAQLQSYEHIVRFAARSRPLIVRILPLATAQADTLLRISLASSKPETRSDTAAPALEAKAPAEPRLAGAPAPGEFGPGARPGIELGSPDPGSGSFSGLLRGVRVVPEQRDGKTVGLRLRGVSPTGLLGLIGLREGDRLETINGYRVTEPNQMLALYVRIRQLDRLSIAIERDGRPVTIEIRIV